MGRAYLAGGDGTAVRLSRLRGGGYGGVWRWRRRLRGAAAHGGAVGGGGASSGGLERRQCLAGGGGGRSTSASNRRRLAARRREGFGGKGAGVRGVFMGQGADVEAASDGADSSASI
jgi:hypothetical protein